MAISEVTVVSTVGLGVPITCKTGALSSRDALRGAVRASELLGLWGDTHHSQPSLDPGRGSLGG